MRTLVDIPDSHIERLDALAAEAKGSRAAEIREAIRLYLERRSTTDWIARGAGYWKDRADVADGFEFQRGARQDRDA